MVGCGEPILFVLLGPGCDVLNALCCILCGVAVCCQPINQPCGLGCCHAVFLHCLYLLPGRFVRVSLDNYDYIRVYLCCQYVFANFIRFFLFQFARPSNPTFLDASGAIIAHWRGIFEVIMYMCQSSQLRKNKKDKENA